MFQKNETDVHKIIFLTQQSWLWMTLIMGMITFTLTTLSHLQHLNKIIWSENHATEPIERSLVGLCLQDELDRSALMHHHTRRVMTKRHSLKSSLFGRSTS